MSYIDILKSIDWLEEVPKRNEVWHTYKQSEVEHNHDQG